MPQFGAPSSPRRGGAAWLILEPIKEARVEPRQRIRARRRRYPDDGTVGSKSSEIAEENE